MAEDSGPSFGDIVKGATILALASFANSAIQRQGQGKSAGTPTPLKQPIPAKWSAFGECARLNPPYALWEVAKSTGRAIDVLLLHAGRIEGLTEIWLNDDKGAAVNGTPATSEAFGLTAAGWVHHKIGGNYRYGLNPDRVRLMWTDGSDAGHWLSPIGAELPPSIWNNTHTGKGIAQLGMICRHGDQSTFARVFPNGSPLPWAAGKWQLVWDPRDEAQDREDPATWVWTANPALQLLAFITTAEGGLNEDYERWIAPHLAFWTAAADLCDEVVETADGEEPRYSAGGGYFHTDNPSETIANLLGAMDGKLLPASDGGYRLFGGLVPVPTLVLTDKDIIRDGTSLTRFRPDDDRVNILQLQYTARDHQWQMVDAPAIRDQDDIDDTGAERSAVFAQPFVTSPSQIQRLGKRRFQRLNAKYSGTIRMGLCGFAAMGEPTLRLQCPELAALWGMPDLTNLVLEVEDAEPDFDSLTVSFQVISAPEFVDGVSPIDEFDPDVDEQPVTPPAPVEDAIDLDAPEIISAAVSLYGGVVRTALTVEPPATLVSMETLSWYVNWRTDPAAAWSADIAFPDIANIPPIVVTAEVPAEDTTLQFRAQYQTEDGLRSDWSEPFDVDTADAFIGAPPAYLIPLTDGAIPPTLITDGAGLLIMIGFDP